MFSRSSPSWILSFAALLLPSAYGIQLQRTGSAMRATDVVTSRATPLSAPRETTCRAIVVT